MQFGIGNKDTLKGSVEAISDENIKVKIEAAAKFGLNQKGESIHAGDIVWDKVFNWYPCY